LSETTYDKLWIPSQREVATTTAYAENDGPKYDKIYNSDYSSNNSNRAKTINGTKEIWTLRTRAYNSKRSYYVHKVSKGGSISVYNNDVNSYAEMIKVDGVCLGFCLGLEPQTITDSWSEIFAAEQDGTYSTKYSIGDTKMLDLGTEGKHLMEIVAFDTDDKADGSGKAKITWISKDQLNTTQKMNASQKTVDGETAYTAGGYEHSDMRAYLKDTVKPLIPETVRNAIVPVTKIQSTYTDGALVKNGQATTDDVWIPSDHEVGFGTGYETTGAVYSSKFTNNASRIKKRMGSAENWWLRSANYTYSFRYVSSDGNSAYSGVYFASGVALGFCT
jgi:hypothetical protein